MVHLTPWWGSGDGVRHSHTAGGVMNGMVVWALITIVGGCGCCYCCQVCCHVRSLLVSCVLFVVVSGCCGHSCLLIIGWLCVVHGGEWALWVFVFVGSCCEHLHLWVVVVGVCVLGGLLVVAVGGWCGRLSPCVARGRGQSLSLSCACCVLGSGCGHWWSLWVVVVGGHRWLSL